MKVKVIAAVGLISLFVLSATVLTSAAQNQTPLSESRPELMIIDPREQLPYLDDGVEPFQPIPQSPEIIPWSKIVFQSYRTLNWEIFTGNDDGTGQQQLTNLPASDLYPRFNRGATRIVFASRREVGTGDYDLFTMNSDGSNVSQLTFTTGDDWNPAYSPDGTKIAFQSIVNNQSDVFVINANGTGLVNLTNHPDYDGAPSWSPDGTKLAFVSRRTGGYRIYSMNANGTNVTQLSTQPYSNNPAWSPDGQRIAYDADTDGSSRVFPEIYLMNADGSGQTMLYRPPGPQDALVTGWSPDGAFVTYTLVHLVLYQGNWYWDTAFIKGLRWYSPGTQALLSPVSFDWDVHWATTEAQAPQSAVDPLPPLSSNPILVSWSGSDNGQTGLKYFDIQVRKGQNGPWTDWLQQTTATSGYYSGGVGGATYYFRSRAWDKALNLEAWPSTPDASTTVENVPPVSAVDPLPAYTRYSPLGFFTSWNGYDPGGSGIANYDVQSRIGNGSWNNFVNGTNLMVDLFTGGNIGQTIYFRSRATDTAQNQESWPGGNGDTQTRLYNWGVRGTVMDNGGAPVVGASATTSPSGLAAFQSDPDGIFGAFVGPSASSYDLNLQKNNYGVLPPATFGAKYDGAVEYVLPPADDVIMDGGFESGVLGGPWLTSGGTISAVVSTDQGHSGDYHLQLGAIPPNFDSTFLADTIGPYIISEPKFVTRDDGRTFMYWNEPWGIVYRWRNPDGTWSPISTGANGGTNAVDHQVVLDKVGNTHIVWDGGDNFIYYVRHNANGSWTSPYKLNSNLPTYFNGMPQLVLDSQNLPHVIWVTSDDPGVGGFYHTYSRRLSNGSWTTPVAVNDPDSTDKEPYSIVMDTQDNLHLIWNSLSGWELFYTRLEGSQWTPIVTLHNDGKSEQPVLARNEQGGVYLMWTVYNQPTTEGIHFRYWSEEKGWSPTQRLASGNESGVVEAFVVGSDGALYVAWKGYDDNLYYAYRDPFGHWSPKEIFGTVPADLANIEIVPGTNGRPHLVWSTESNVFYRYQKADGAWANTVNLPSNSIEFGAADIALDSANVLHIAYGKRQSEIYYIGQVFTDTADNISVQQVVNIPLQMTSPVLSFMYQLGGAYDTSGSSALIVEVDDGISTTPVLDISQSTGPSWTHGFSDLSAWAGETVTISFTLNQAADAPLAWARIDEVTLGSGYPDLWAALGDGAGLPGEEVTIALTYGNQGGVTASGVHITQTLPTGLTFVSADVTPISTSPLVWDVGDLPAGSGPFTIMVTLKINNNAPPLVYLTSTATIAPTGQELETANNVGQGQIFTGTSLYLPVVRK